LAVTIFALRMFANWETVRVEMFAPVVTFRDETLAVVMFAPAMKAVEETFRDETFSDETFRDETLRVATFAPAMLMVDETFRLVMLAEVTLRDVAFIEVIQEEPNWVANCPRFEEPATFGNKFPVRKVL
jgi:hypothetical protein